MLTASLHYRPESSAYSVYSSNTALVIYSSRFSLASSVTDSYEINLHDSASGPFSKKSEHGPGNSLHHLIPPFSGIHDVGSYLKIGLQCHKVGHLQDTRINGRCMLDFESPHDRTATHPEHVNILYCFQGSTVVIQRQAIE